MEHQSQGGDWKNQIVQEYRRQRSSGSTASEAWQHAKEQFMQSYTSGSAEQAWKNYSGNALEQIVAEEFQKQLESRKANQQIRVQRWNEIEEDLVKKILSEPLWLRGELQEPYLAESQVDFVATELKNGYSVRVIAVYSCKTSLRERFQQDLFWADRLRARGIRFCLITLDNDGAIRRAIQEGQLRSKQAKMAAALYDRVYLFEKPIRHFQRIFRPVDRLVEDLKQWLKAG